MSGKKRGVSAYLDNELLERLGDYAERRGFSKSTALRSILIEHLDRGEGINPLQEEGGEGSPGG